MNEYKEDLDLNFPHLSNGKLLKKKKKALKKKEKKTKSKSKTVFFNNSNIIIRDEAKKNENNQFASNIIKMQSDENYSTKKFQNKNINHSEDQISLTMSQPLTMSSTNIKPNYLRSNKNMNYNNDYLNPFSQQTPNMIKKSIDSNSGRDRNLSRGKSFDPTNSKLTNENHFRSKNLLTNMNRKLSLTMKEFDSSARSGSEMFNISRNSKKHSFKESNNLSYSQIKRNSRICMGEDSDNSQGSRRSILKKKLVETKVKYYKPFKPKHKTIMFEDNSLGNIYTQRHLQMVNSTIQNQLEEESKLSGKSNSSNRSGLHNTIFVGKNKILIRSIVENKAKETPAKNNIRAKKIKNKIIKSNLTNKKIIQGGTNQNISDEETQKIMSRVIEEDMKLGYLNKMHRHHCGTLKRAKKGPGHAAKKDYLKESLNTKIAEKKQFMEDTDFKIIPKDSISYGNIMKHFSTTQLRKTIQEMEEAEAIKMIEFPLEKKIKPKSKKHQIKMYIPGTYDENIKEMESKMAFEKKKILLKVISMIPLNSETENKSSILVPVFSYSEIPNIEEIEKNKRKELFAEINSCATADDETEAKEKNSMEEDVDDTVNETIQEETEYNTEEENELINNQKDLVEETVPIVDNPNTNKCLLNDGDINVIYNKVEIDNIMNPGEDSFYTKPNFSGFKKEAPVEVLERTRQYSKKNDKKVVFVMDIGSSDDDEIDADGKFANLNIIIIKILFKVIY